MKNLVPVTAVFGWLILLAAIGWLGATVHQVEIEVKTVRENVRHLG